MIISSQPKIEQKLRATHETPPYVPFLSGKGTSLLQHVKIQSKTTELDDKTKSDSQRSAGLTVIELSPMKEPQNRLEY